MITTLLIAANVVVYLLQMQRGDAFTVQFALWPWGHYFVRGLGEVGFEPWQLVTSAFLHGSLTHIAINLFVLNMFGREVERALGPPRFLVLYTAAILTSAATQLLVVSLAADPIPTLGASGGVFGVLLAFGRIFPRRIVMLLIPPIPMRARTFVFGYAALELVQGFLGTQSGVAHFAHVGGMLGPWLLLRRWRPARRE